MLVEAIGRGAPKFNAGDIKGCANIYRQAAETALRSSNATEGQKMRLRAGLQGAGGSASDEAAAWALRNAFDDVLAGNAGVFNTKSAFAFSSSSQPNSASAGFNRGIHATQIVMGLISIVFSCSFQISPFSSVSCISFAVLKRVPSGMKTASQVFALLRNTARAPQTHM